jgi:hypothetical protein
LAALPVDRADTISGMLFDKHLSCEHAKETAEMGWSEQYWEDAKAELEQPATESEPTSEDDTLGRPAAGQPTDSTAGTSSR